MMHQMMGVITILAAGLGALLLAGTVLAANNGPGVSKARFGKLAKGTSVDIYTLRNSKGMEARIMTYGGILVSLKVPDRDGKLGDVVLGHDDPASYESNNSPYFGALIGRYGNRIAAGKFTLEGKNYSATVNNSPNMLHGGNKGFDKVIWKVKEIKNPEGPSIELTYVSKDGEEGFPGKLNVTAVYTLTEDNSLKIEFTATTDKTTVVNLTAHSYFNLAGKGNILDDSVYINADKFTPVNTNLIPTGELKPVDGTPFDFRTPTKVGARIEQVDEQIKFGNGYDHNWVLNKKPGEMSVAARVSDPTTGRTLEVSTTEPGVQFYTGNFLDGTQIGKGGWKYQFRNGLCFEPQHFPDSPNQPNFPSTTLKPGETYHNTIVYKFTAN